MSFEATMSNAVADFKVKFAGQHREAMEHEFTTAYVLMMDSHASLNDAERVLGVDLTPLPFDRTPHPVAPMKPLSLVKAPVEPVEASAKVEVLVGVRVKREDIARVRKAAKMFDLVRKGSTELTKRTHRAELAAAILEARENGMSWVVVGRLCGRSNSWAINFVRDSRRMGLI